MVFKSATPPCDEQGRFEEFLAALVLIDAADVHREAIVDAVFLPEASRLRAGRDFRTDADDNRGHLQICRSA